MELNPNLLLRRACVPSLSLLDEAIKKARTVVCGVQMVDEGSRLVLGLDAYHKSHIRSVAKHSVDAWKARLLVNWAPISLNVMDNVDEGWICRIAANFQEQRGSEATAFFVGDAVLPDSRSVSVSALDTCGVSIVSFTGSAIRPMLNLYFPIIWHENGTEINGLLTAVFLHNHQQIYDGSISVSFAVTENKCLAHSLWLLITCEQMLTRKLEVALWLSRYQKILERYAAETKHPELVEEFSGASFPLTEIQRRKLCSHARLSTEEIDRFLALWKTQGTVGGLSYTEDSVLPRSFYVEFGVRCNEMWWQKVEEIVDVPGRSLRSLMSVADGPLEFDALKGRVLAQEMLQFHQTHVLGKDEKWREIRRVAGDFAKAKNAHLRKYFQ